MLHDKGPRRHLVAMAYVSNLKGDEVASPQLAIDYFLFDVPYFEGYDLREVALVERRRLLKALIDEKGAEHVRYSADFPGDPASVLQSACKMKLEGVIAKRSDAPYASRRTETWLKLKCKLRQDFVVCGYTDRSDGASQVGSLLLGVYEDGGKLVSVGSVGTGWNAAEAAELKMKLQKLEADAVPFAAGPGKPGRWSKRRAGSERWVQPKLVAEVEYAEITPDGQIRHGAFVSLRTDKAPKSIRRETATTPESATPARPAGKAAAAGIKVSRGDRVIDRSAGLTKLAWATALGPFRGHDPLASHSRLLEVATAQGLAGAADVRHRIFSHDSKS